MVGGADGHALLQSYISVSITTDVVLLLSGELRSWLCAYRQPAIVTLCTPACLESVSERSGPVRFETHYAENAAASPPSACDTIFRPPLSASDRTIGMTNRRPSDAGWPVWAERLLHPSMVSDSTINSLNRRLVCIPTGSMA